MGGSAIDRREDDAWEWMVGTTVSVVTRASTSIIGESSEAAPRSARSA